MKIKKVLYKKKRDVQGLLLATTYLSAHLFAFVPGLLTPSTTAIPMSGSFALPFTLPIFVSGLSAPLTISVMPVLLPELFTLLSAFVVPVLLPGLIAFLFASVVPMLIPESSDFLSTSAVPVFVPGLSVFLSGFAIPRLVPELFAP